MTGDCLHDSPLSTQAMSYSCMMFISNGSSASSLSICLMLRLMTVSNKEKKKNSTSFGQPAEDERMSITPQVMLMLNPL